MQPTRRFLTMLAVIITMVMLQAFGGRHLVDWLVDNWGISYQSGYGGLLLLFALLNAYTIYVMCTREKRQW